MYDGTNNIFFLENATLRVQQLPVYEYGASYQIGE